MAEDRIGNYRLFDEIGRGGMGIVFKAEQTNLGRFVALKVVHPYLTGDPVVMKRFDHEARAAALLNHPNIVQVYDVGADEDQHYIAMEYVPGRTLASVLENARRLSPEETLRIADQVAAALSAAHDVGIVHRDVKPSNILLDDSGKVKVTDFGIAVAAGQGQQTDEGHLVGTARYMSPEHARGEELDGRTDLYALGVVMYEMLTGAPPFDDPDGESGPLATLERHVNDPVPPMEGVPFEVEALVLRCLEKRRVDRPRTAREFRRLLREAAGGIDWQGPALLPLEPSESGFDPDPSFRFDRAGVVRSATDRAAFSLTERMYRARGPFGRFGRRLSAWLHRRVLARRDSCKAKRLDLMELKGNLALAEQQLDQAKRDCDRAHEKYEKADAELHEWQMSGSLVLDRGNKLGRESAAVQEKKLWQQLTSYKLQWQNLQDRVRDWYGNVDRVRRNHDAAVVELEMLTRRRRSVAEESGVARRNRLRLFLTLAVVVGGGAFFVLQRLAAPPRPAPPGAGIEGRFGATGALFVARDEHAAAPLDGDRVLLAGGIDASREALASAEIFSRARGEFAPTGSLIEPRFNHTLETLADGRVLVIGGERKYGASDVLASVEIFIKDRFAAGTPLREARTRHRSTRLPDGTVLVTGGSGPFGRPLASAEIYDGATNNWTTVGRMHAARRDHTASALADGRVVVIGGDQGNDAPLASVEVYDPVAKQFDNVCTLRQPRFEHAAVPIDTRRVLVFGGRQSNRSGDALATIELVDLQQRTSTIVGQMRMRRKVHTATLLSGVQPPAVLLVGGALGEPGRRNVCELYVFGATETCVAGLLSYDRNNHTATPLGDGSILFAGGHGQDSQQPLAPAELYVRTAPRPAR